MFADVIASFDTTFAFEVAIGKTLLTIEVLHVCPVSARVDCT